MIQDTLKTMEQRFDETKFVKEGGSCFECCDYEAMYMELKWFIQEEIKRALEEKRECDHEWEIIAYVGINSKEIGECSKCGKTYEGEQPKP